MGKTLHIRVPDFFLLGAAKAGTTTLYSYLIQNEKLYFPTLKEPHFFDDPEAYSRGIEWYSKSFFPEESQCCLCGDATPVLHLPKIVGPRISQTYENSAVKPRFVVVLRDPVERAWSHYLHRKRNMVESESFEAALDLEEERLSAKPTAWVGYFRDGLYGQQMETWFELFGQEKFLVLLNEELRKDPSGTVNQILSFLGVEDGGAKSLASLHSNTASAPRSDLLMRLLAKPPFALRHASRLLMSRNSRRRIKYYLRQKNTHPFEEKPTPYVETAKMLRQRYQEDLLKLEGLIDKDISSWRTTSTDNN